MSSENELALAPCPFCGSPARLHSVPDTFPAYVDCSECDCAMEPADYQSVEDAISRWNSRARRPILSDEAVERAAKVIDPNIVPLITEYCQKKGYTEAETAEKFAGSGRWAQAKALAREALTAALSPPPEPAPSSPVPVEGVQTVPVKPTKAMIEAGYKALMDWDARTGEDLGIWDVYSAMLSAAPAPPTGGSNG